MGRKGRWTCWKQLRRACVECITGNNAGQDAGCLMYA
jgi:hypothetical protein